MLARGRPAHPRHPDSWEAGFEDAAWARRDPDLMLLHGDSEFERLDPAEATEGGPSKPEGEGR